MKWGLDAAVGPTNTEAFVWREAGYEWMAGYVGGKADHVWPLSEWGPLERYGLAPLPIWVAPLTDDPGREAGVLDGNRCLAALVALRLSGMAVLDVENGLVPREYAEGFVDALGEGSCDATLYGSPTTLLGLVGVPFTNWWLASWPVQGELLHLPARPDWSLWQYATGPRCDYSVARDDFAFATFNW